MFCSRSCRMFLRQSVCHKGSAPLPRPLQSSHPKVLPSLMPNPQARLQPSLQPNLQQVSPFQYVEHFQLFGPPEKVARIAYSAIDLSTHCNMVFHGHFMHAMPLSCACLVLCGTFLEIPCVWGGCHNG